MSVKKCPLTSILPSKLNHLDKIGYILFESDAKKIGDIFSGVLKFLCWKSLK